MIESQEKQENVQQRITRKIYSKTAIWIEKQKV